ncbi:hypothetical protein EAI_04605, partial [Harpegnathos saltator]
EVDVLGCDGTNTNTGWKAGILRKLEELTRKPMQWAVCLLHFNELPFRALFTHIDSASSSPHSYTGPIGSILSDCEKLSVVSFKPIKCDLPYHNPEELRKLSKDLRYLFQISQAIDFEALPERLASMIPGKLNKARWLTTANRILRLYIATKKPVKKFIEIVTFILTVYVVMQYR